MSYPGPTPSAGTVPSTKLPSQPYRQPYAFPLSFGISHSSLSIITLRTIKIGIGAEKKQKQNSMSSGESLSTNSSAEQRNDADAESHQPSVLANVKHQIDSVTGGRSLSELGNQVSSVAGEKVQDAKETVLPVAEGAIHTVQTQIQSWTGATDDGNVQNIDPAVDASEQQKVDQLDTERICDFLREKHMSTKPPPSVK